MEKCVSLSATNDKQQKGAHLEERAEQIARRSDMLPWQRNEGGMWRQGGEGGEGGREGGREEAHCIMQLAAGKEDVASLRFKEGKNK